MSGSGKFHIGRVLSNRKLAEGHYRMGIAVPAAFPEAAPGQNDADPLFLDFYRMVEARKAGKI